VPTNRTSLMNLDAREFRRGSDQPVQPAARKTFKGARRSRCGRELTDVSFYIDSDWSGRLLAGRPTHTASSLCRERADGRVAPWFAPQIAPLFR